MIVMVDDDIDDLELFQEMLDKSSYAGESVQVNNGQELLDFLRASPDVNPELIMLDLNMPVKNGFQALEEIKSDTALQSIPVVILSATSNEKDRAKCLELGCTLFLKKPHSISGYDELVKAVLNLLDNNQQPKK
jgi:CheY-like chemotaxis protein